MIPKTLQLFAGLAAAGGLLIAAALPAGAQSLSINASGGTGFNPAIFGQGLNNQAFYTQGRGTAYEKNLGLLNGTSVRGPSEGSNAMTYNWKTRVDKNQGTPAPGGGYAKGKSTLGLLRDVRDYGATPIITVNEQGIGTFDGSGDFAYTDKTIDTMTLLASDWVRYTNRIVQNYRQGDTITDTEDLRILNSLSWGGPDFNNDLLLAPGEAAVPKVTYWEIGNESEYYDTPDTYRSRYHAITTAMLAQDSNIKVGAGLAGMQGPLNGASSNYLNRLLEPQFVVFGPRERVDFVAYHPYGYQVLSVDAGNPANHGAVSQELNNIKTNQQVERDWINGKINVAGRNPNDFEFLATEWNSAYPSPPPGGDGNWRIRQWNALGIVETTMTYAQMGFSSAQFWLWPAYINTGAELPQYKAFQALTQYGGDTLVDSYSENNFRLYVTKDSDTGTIAIWGMNFLYGDPADVDKTIHLSLSNLGITPGEITLMRLANTTGRTTLLSGNSYNYLPSGVTTVDWITSDLTGLDLSNFNFTVKPAELSLLIIQPNSDPGDFNEDGTVDAADYVVWRNGGSPDSTLAGYNLWKANFGIGSTGSGSSFAGAAVPEPSSWIMVSLAFVGLLVARRAS